jgi:hypothetical protein
MSAGLVVAQLGCNSRAASSAALKPFSQLHWLGARCMSVIPQQAQYAVLDNALVFMHSQKNMYNGHAD